MDNRDSNETLRRFRRENLRELLLELERCVSGYDHRVMPFITNRQGQYSEKKTLQLVSRLTAGLGPEDSGPLCSFYRSVLYCAIRAFSTPCTVQSGSVTLGMYNPDFTFTDLIGSLHSEELESNENDDETITFGILKRPIYGNLSINMTALYTFLSGGKEPVTCPLEGEFFPLHTCPWEPSGCDAEEFSDDSYEEFLQQEPCRLEAPFPVPEAYCGHYENMLKLFPGQYQRERFDRHMQVMADHFLMEQNLTFFSDGDTYLTTITYLKKALKFLKSQQR